MENNIIKNLIAKGVKIPAPESIFVKDDVNPDRISGENVIIYPGCKIIGNKSLIMKGSSIGYEAPATLENTLVGENTKLKGGFFKEAVFAGYNSFGSGGHVRKGTILEEEASAAHTVGLKQTVIFPFVTLGSLINFCDCFIAGGTSRKNHSEVGSSFVHFNYTPNQDKSTPSMMGNVHQGVMLNQNPVFLGGQGGIVGPVRLGFGCVTPAGSIIRKNELNNDRLVIEKGFLKDMSVQVNYLMNVKNIFNNNIYYIAGLISLWNWYKNIRTLFVYDIFSRELVNGMQNNLKICIDERIEKLKDFCGKLESSEKKSNYGNLTLTHRNAIDKFLIADEIFKKELKKDNLNDASKKFIQAVEKKKKEKKKYINAIQSLEPEISRQGSKWLFDIENRIVEKLLI